MIRVLQIGTGLGRGGAESMIMNHYRRFDRDRVQLDFLVFREDEGGYEDEIRDLGGRIHRIVPHYPWNYLPYRRQFHNLMMQHPEYRVIHSHIEERSVWPLTIAKQHGVPARIAHAHSYYPPSLDPKYPVRLALRAELRLRRPHTHAMSCSDTAGDWLFGAGNHCVWPNAIDTERFHFDPAIRAAIRAGELQVDETTPVFGQVAHLNRTKNPLFTLDRFADYLSDGGSGVLVFIGKGPLRDELLVEAQRLGIADQIRVQPPVARIEDWYQAMDLLLMPSIHEGLPLVPLEAAASGLDVLVSEAVPSEADIAGNHRRTPLSTPAAWVQNLRETQPQLPGERSATSELRIARLAQAGFDVGESAVRLQQLYQDLGGG